MAKYPVQIDTALTLPSAIDGTTPVAGYVVNRLRDAILQIENELGIKPSGIYATVRNRLDNLEASINNTDGAGALIVANIPLPGQDPIWTGSQWLAGGTPTPSPYGNPIVNNYLTADILTTGGIQAGPIQSTQLDTGLITLEGKLVANPILTTLVSNPNQGIIYYDGYSNQFLVSQNGGAYVPMLSTNMNVFTAGGDLSGNNTTQTVIRIQNIPVHSGTPTNNQVLTYDATDGYWYGATSPAFPTIPTTLPPDGYAGGDLSGSYPNPTVAKINGVAVPSAGAGLIDGYVLTVTGSFAVSYAKLNLSNTNTFTGVLPAANQAPQTLSGQVSGPANATVVNKINGASVPISGALIPGYTLQVSGANSLIYNLVSLNSGVQGSLPFANQDQQPMVGDVDGYTGANTVTAIQNIGVLTTAPTMGQFLGFDGYHWTPTTLPPPVIPPAYPVGPAGGDLDGYYPNPGVGAIQGVAISTTIPTDGQLLQYSDGYHAWVPSSVSGVFVASGDLTGNSSSQVVSGIQTIPVLAGTPADGNVLTYVAANSDWEPLAPTPVPTSLPPNGPATGDLGLTYPNPIVTGIQGNPISNAGPVVDDVLAWDGYAWNPQALEVTVTGPAGGDLDGYYPNPTVIKINGVAVTGTPVSGYVLTATSPSAASWAIAASGFTPGGDLSGSSTSQTVTGLQNIHIKAGTPTDGYVLTYVAADGYWEAVATAPTFSAGGDLTGTNTSQTVISINGATVPVAGALTPGNILQVNGVSGLTYAPINLAGGANYLTGLLPTANQAAQIMGGDISGTTAASTVTKLQNISVKAGTPSDGYALIYVAADGYWEPVAISGSPTGSAGGDLGGVYPDPTVLQINGTAVNASPTANTVLVATSGTTSIWSQILDGYVAAGAAISGTKINPAFGTQNISTTGTLSSGDLTATGIQDTTLTLGAVLSSADGYLSSGTINLASATYVTGILPAANQAAQAMGGAVGGTTAASTISFTGNTFITGLLPTANQVSQNLTLTGDVTSSGGTTASATTSVIKIQGNAVQSVSLGSTQDGYVATWVNADGYIEFKPTVATTSVTMGGDISGSSGSAIVAKLDGYSLPSPTAGVLQEVGGALTWSAVNLASSIYVTGVLPTANQAAQSMGGAVGGTTAASTITLTGNSFITGILPSANQASQTMLGDVNGTTAASTVVALQGNKVKSVALGSSQDGYVATWVNADGYVEFKPAAVTAFVTMSGDITGPSNASILSSIDGYALPNPGNHIGLLHSSGAALTWSSVSLTADVSGILPIANQAAQTMTGAVTGTTAASTIVLTSNANITGLLPAANQASQTMGGDVSGTTAASTVIKLQGNPIKAATYASSQDGYVLTWVNSDGYIEAKPLPPTVTSVTMGGDISGSSATSTVIKLQGNAIKAATFGASQDGYVLTWVNADGYIEAKPAATTTAVTLSGDVTGSSATNVVSAISGSSPIAITPANLQWKSTTVSPTLSIAAYSTTGSNAGTTLNIIGQTGQTTLVNTLAATVGVSNGSNIANGAGSSNTIVAVNDFVIFSSQSAAQYQVTTVSPTSFTFTPSYTGTTQLSGVTVKDLGNNTTIPNNNGGNITITSGAAGTGGAGLAPNGTPGNIIFNIPSSGGYIQNQLGGGTYMQFGENAGGTGTIWLGASTPSTGSTTYALSGTSANTSVNAPSGTLSLQVAASSILTVNASNVAIPSIVSAPFLKTDVSGNIIAGTGTPVTSVSTAGGDLSGTYPNPTVSKIDGYVVQVTNTATQDGYALTWVNASNQYQLKPVTVSSVVMGGDVTGNSNASTVAKIQGNAVKVLTNTAAQDGYVFSWVNANSDYELVKYAGDITGKPGASVVSAISGVSPISITPANLQFLSTTSAPIINQATVASGTGQTLTIQAQSSSSGSGGNLILKSGTHTTTGLDGYVFLETDGTVQAFVTPAISGGTLAGLGIGPTPGVSPVIAAGTGAPSTASPNGSIFLRTDGTSGTGIYTRQGGTWTAVGAGSGTSLTGPVTSTVRQNTSTTNYLMDTTNGIGDYIVLNSNTLTNIDTVSLTGAPTATVTAGSTGITLSAGATITAGTYLVFGTDTVSYALATAFTGGTTGNLATPYQGPTASGVAVVKAQTQVTNGSANITFGTAQNLAAGTAIKFGNDPVSYVLASAVVSTTAGTLTQSYQGGTNTAGITATTFAYYGGQYTLPAPTAGRIIKIKDTTGFAETNPINILPNGTELIEGSYSYVTLTGTVTTTNASATVVGSGTTFTTQVSPGNTIIIDGYSSAPYVVLSITDNTHLILTSAITSGNVIAGASAKINSFTYNTNFGTLELTADQAGVNWYITG